MSEGGKEKTKKTNGPSSPAPSTITWKKTHSGLRCERQGPIICFLRQVL